LDCYYLWHNVKSLLNYNKNTPNCSGVFFIGSGKIHGSPKSILIGMTRNGNYVFLLMQVVCLYTNIIGFHISFSTQVISLIKDVEQHKPFLDHA